MSKEKEAWEYFEKALRCVGLLAHERALIQYDLAINLNPNNPEFYSKKGHSLFVLGRTKEAIECYEKAVDLEPYNNQYQERLNTAIEKLHIDTDNVTPNEQSSLLGEDDS